MTNYQQAKQLILNSILEGKSTASLSVKLGYSFNKVKRWQNGSKQFRWNEFCDLCVVTKTPLAEALASTFGILNSKRMGVYRIVLHLKTFLRTDSASTLSKMLGISPTVTQRYLLATTFPDIEIVLELMDQRADFLDLFLENLLHLKKTSTADKSIINLPWAVAVVNATSLKEHLDLEEFSANWIAEFVGVSAEQVNQAIELMVELNLIEKNGAHYGPTLARTIGVLNQKSEKVKYAQFIRYWMRRSELRFATADANPINKNETPNKDAFRIFAASSESAQKISDVIMKAEQEIHDLLQRDTQEKTDVRVLLLHHFSVQDFKS